MKPRTVIAWLRRINRLFTEDGLYRSTVAGKIRQARKWRDAAAARGDSRWRKQFAFEAHVHRNTRNVTFTSIR